MGGDGMLRYCWLGMLAAGILVGLLTGQGEGVTQALLGGAEKGASLCLGLAGSYCLWMGVLAVAEKSGLAGALARAFRGPVTFLLTGVRRGSKAISHVAMNLAANLLGMGNAATPFGLKAMAALQEENPDKSRPSDAMCQFLLLNTASVQLIPTTVISLRAAAGAARPGDILLPALLATGGTALFAWTLGRLCAGWRRGK